MWEENAGKTLTAEHKAKISSSAKGNGSKWKNATAVKEQWAKADICYNLFLQNVQQTQMSRETQLPVSFCQSLIKHFRSGWNPLNDTDWLSTFN